MPEYGMMLGVCCYGHLLYQEVLLHYFLFISVDAVSEENNFHVYSYCKSSFLKIQMHGLL